MRAMIIVLFLGVWLDSNAQDIFLTGVFDGPLAGGTPKGIELYAAQDVSDLSSYGLGTANNGEGSDGEEYVFPAVAMSKGTFFYVSTPASNMIAFFGFDSNFKTGVLNINGNDAIELYYNGSVVDTFGFQDVDGSGQAWDYMDGWAYRNQGALHSTPFEQMQWQFSGTNALDGAAQNGMASQPFPFKSYQHKSVVVTPAILDLGFVSFGQASVSLPFRLSFLNLEDSITIRIPAPFLISEDSMFFDKVHGPVWLDSIWQNTNKKLFINFTPPADNNAFYQDTIRIEVDSLEFCIPIKGVEGAAPPKSLLSEFHYDNVGTDSNEFVEIAVENGTYDIGAFALTLYNGVNGKEYAIYNGSEFTRGETWSNYDYWYIDLPVNGIQNGPDGIALQYENRMLQFIAYEGSFSAANGIAVGHLAELIAPKESNDWTLEEASIHFIGSAAPFEGYFWENAAVHSKGAHNQLNPLSMTFKSFTVTQDRNGNWVRWATVNESNCAVYRVQFSEQGTVFQDLVKIPCGNTAGNNTYVELVNLPSPGYVRVVGEDWDGVQYFGPLIRTNTSTICLDEQKKWCLNPDDLVTYQLHDLNGRLLKTGQILADKWWLHFWQLCSLMRQDFFLVSVYAQGALYKWRYFNGRSNR